MKSIFILILFAVVITARADFVIQQKIEGANENGIKVFKFKGDKERTDMPTDLLGPVSVIEDLKTGDRIMMIHQRKEAKMESFAEFKQQLGPIGGDEAPKVVNTGRFEKVGDYNAEIYAWTNNLNAGGMIWVATNYPDFPKFQALYKKLEQSPTGQLLGNAQPGASTLPGMIVKSYKKTPQGEVTMTLISAKEEPVGASDFQIPPDYRVLGLQFGK